MVATTSARQSRDHNLSLQQGYTGHSVAVDSAAGQASRNLTIAHPPDFAIAGVEKGGTTGLAWHLRYRRNGLCLYGRTEYHAVDSVSFLRQPTWPRIPSDACNLMGFDDPNLFYISPTHATLLLAAAPAIRLVVLLREPVQRTYSRWQMEARRGFEYTFNRHICRSFEACVFNESARLLAPPPRSEFDIVRRGLYAEPLEALQRAGFAWVAPHKAATANTNLLLTVSERLFANPLHEYNRVLAYLGQAPFERLPNTTSRAMRRGAYQGTNELSARTIEHLYKLYKNSTQRVYKLIHERIHEWDAWYEAAGLGPPGSESDSDGLQGTT